MTRAPHKVECIVATLKLSADSSEYRRKLRQRGIHYAGLFSKQSDFNAIKKKDSEHATDHSAGQTCKLHIPATHIFLRCAGSGNDGVCGGGRGTRAKRQAR